jgi:urease gamma subunit
MELVRDGHTLEHVQEQAKRVLGEKQVQRGVSKMINEISLEATFKDGIRSFKIVDPICREFGDFDLTFYGSFLPIPSKELFEVS